MVWSEFFPYKNHKKGILPLKNVSDYQFCSLHLLHRLNKIQKTLNVKGGGG